MNWKRIFANEMGNEAEDVEPCTDWKVRYRMKLSVGNFFLEEALCGKTDENDREWAKHERASMEESARLTTAPPCVHRGGCPYGDTSCKLYDFLCQTDERFFRTDLVARYKAYDEWLNRGEKSAQSVLV